MWSLLTENAASESSESNFTLLLDFKHSQELIGNCIIGLLQHVKAGTHVRTKWFANSSH